MNPELIDKYEKLLNHCAKTNTDKFNQEKALEESLEFSEVIVKRSTKHQDNPNRPQKSELISEYGDLIYRGMIFLMQEFSEMTAGEINNAVTGRVIDKLDALKSYKKTGKYKKGL